MTAGAVVSTADIPADRTAVGVRLRTVLDCGSDDSPGLVRRLVEIRPGSRFDGSAGSAGELWFVIEGSGRLEIDGHSELRLRPDQGLWIPPGAAYRLHAGGSDGNGDGDGELRLDTVTLPAGTLPDGKLHEGNHATAAAAEPLSRDLDDCEVETTGDRKFRVLFGPGRGCSVATQFVGEIPPGRAPDHSHPYDEVVLVLAGEGKVHIAGAEHALSAGTCTHLPPGLLHCLENTGSMMMRVLGVFHPADSPAAKLEQHP